MRSHDVLAPPGQELDVDGALRFVRGGAAYASGYDGNGNMTYRCVDGKGLVFTWDHGNHLVAITQTTGVTTYAYDGEGQRVKMVSGGVTTCYVGGYYEYTSAGTTRKYYYFAGKRVAVYDGSAAHCLFGDHLGSTNVSYRISNGTTATQRYYVWGAIRSTSGTLPTDYAFTEQRLDASGLLDYNARWYDPALARFVSADSIVPQPGNPQSLNRFAYCLNNPARFTDPSGHIAIRSTRSSQRMLLISRSRCTSGFTSGR